MKRIHYLLLGLLVSLTIAAVSPSSPPTRIAPGSGVTVTTNGLNSFTIAASGGGSGVLTSNGYATNLTIYSSAIGSNALQVYSASGLSGLRVDGSGNTKVDRGLTTTNLVAYDTVQLQGTTYINGPAESSSTTLFNGTNTFSGPIVSSGNNTFTGTNTFTPAKFFPANNIGIRKLWSCPTNIYLTSLATTANPTNHGDFANITKLAQVEVPALLSSNSAFSMSLTFVRTTAQASASFIYLYVGTNTNYIGSVQIGGTAVGTSMEFRPAGVVFWHNVHSFSTQMQAGFNSPAYFNSPSNFVDTSVPFKVYLGAATATGHTNLSVYDITMFESVR